MSRRIDDEESMRRVRRLLAEAAWREPVDWRLGL